MKIRIKFQKQGTVRFIGHLDVMRYFQKVMRRAEVDIRYSEGFSPHQIMSFASPLSVGLISHAEYVDIDVNSSGNSNEARIAERKEYVPAMVADWYPDLENETVEEEKQAEGICVFLRLLSGSAANGKPEQVLQAFYESLGLTYRPFAIQVEREELYADEGAEGAPEYVPLEAYGSEIV